MARQKGLLDAARAKAHIGISWRELEVRILFVYFPRATIQDPVPQDGR